MVVVWVGCEWVVVYVVYWVACGGNLSVVGVV